MQPDCRNSYGFPVLHKAEGHPQASLPAFFEHPRPTGLLSRFRAIADLERIVAGLSLTAGGVLGVLVARIVG